MTADPRPFTEAAEGTGPAELDYRGPQGWATVVHRAHQGSFTLTGGDGTWLVRMFDPGEPRTGEPRTREYKVGLSGPQRLRVEAAEQWSISVTPLEADEVEDSGVWSRTGIGNQTVEIVKPDPERAAILEFTKVVGDPFTEPALYRITDSGYRLDLLSHRIADGTDRTRFLIDHPVGPARPVTGRVEIVSAHNCEWRLRVLPLSAARPLETTATGTGEDVLVYSGPPAVLTLRQVKSWSPVEVMGDDIESGQGRISLSTTPLCPSRASVIGIDPEPTLLQTTGGGGWELRLTPLDELRTFDREISGTLGEVVRYTGPPAAARVSTRSWQGWVGNAEFGTLTAEFSRKGSVVARGGPLARFRHNGLDLLPGMLVRVDAPDNGAGWRIRLMDPPQDQRWPLRREGYDGTAT